jgi:hypothetical protein
MSERAAFYALAPGGWRDYWSLLHPPYTLWHLSYVALGAATADDVEVGWLLETLAAFFLAMGIAAHALDELRGRPLGTRIPARVLVALAVTGLAGATALGVHGIVEVSPWVGAFIAVGVFLVVAYNLELAGGRFHSDLWFALAWGGFPVLTAAFAQTATVTPAAVLVAAGCVALSSAQRVLSTPVRILRRHAVDVSGEIELADGSHQPIDGSTLRGPAEAALRLLSLAVPLLAAGVLLARLT